jgi:predicted metal-dependent hydrolase
MRTELRINQDEQRRAVREWARLFNLGLFYAAHEVAEQAWFLTDEPERTVFKGLVHAAVSLSHWQRGNAHGGRVKCVSSQAYLENAGPQFLGLDVADLIREMQRFASWMEQEQPGPFSFPVRPPQARLREERPIP